MAFEGHSCCWHIYGHNMVIINTVCCGCFFGLECAVMWGLYGDYSSSVVGYTCTMWEVYFIKGHMPIL